MEHSHKYIILSIIIIGSIATSVYFYSRNNISNNSTPYISPQALKQQQVFDAKVKEYESVTIKPETDAEKMQIIKTLGAKKLTPAEDKKRLEMLDAYAGN